MHSSLDGVQSLSDVRNQVFLVLNAQTDANQLGGDARVPELLVGELPVGGGGGIQAAGAGIGHVGLDCAQLQVLHEGGGRLAPALEAEADHAATAFGQVLLGQLVVLVPGQTGVVHIGHLRMAVQEFGHGLTVFHMLGHADVEGFEAQIQQKSVLGGLDGAEVPHELGGALGDEGAGQTELFHIGDAVIALVGGAQAGELVRMGCPVELAAVHDGAAHRRAVAVHVLGGGVGDDVRAPLKGTAVDGGGEGVVHNQGHAVGVGHLGELLNVQYGQGRVGNGLAKHGLGVGLEGGAQLLLAGVGGDEGGSDAHLRHGHGDKVEGAAVDGGAGDDVVPALADVEQGEEVGRLTGGGQHGGGAALHLRDFRRHIVVGGVLEPGVEVAAGLQIEQLAHVLAGVIFEGGGLDDGNLAGLAVAGGVAALYALGADFVLAHGVSLLISSLCRVVYVSCGAALRFLPPRGLA